MSGQCAWAHIYMYSKKTIANNSSPPSTNARTRTRTRTHTTRHDTAHSWKESKKFSDTIFVQFHTVLCKSTLLLVKHKVLAIKNNPNALSAQFMCIGSSSFHRIWVEDKAKQPRRYRTHTRAPAQAQPKCMIWFDLYNFVHFISLLDMLSLIHNAHVFHCGLTIAWSVWYAFWFSYFEWMAEQKLNFPWAIGRSQLLKVSSEQFVICCCVQSERAHQKSVIPGSRQWQAMNVSFNIIYPFGLFLS